MENLTNGRGEKLYLTSKDVLESLRRLSSDSDERAMIADQLFSRLNLPTLIDVLYDFFGSYKEMVDITGVADKRVIKRWRTGIKRPQGPAPEEQLRLGFKICTIIYSEEAVQVYKKWFKDPNSFLNNNSPIEVLRQKNLRGVSRFSGEVINAAKEFQRASIV